MKNVYTLVFICLTTATFAQQSIVGYWSGKLSIGSMMSYNAYIEIKQRADSLTGWFDIPAQNVNGLKVSNIRMKDSNLSFDVRASLGTIMRFNTICNGQSINGSVQQGGSRINFTATRTATNTSPAFKTPGRKEDSLFVEEEVRIALNDETELAGTLLLPKKRGASAVPCVVFLSGTGQQDRDETIYGFRGFKMIAEALALKGIASLRCDDRCTGGSRGDIFSFTTRDLAKDAAGCVDWLKKRSDINPNAIAMLGHSEGGIVAGMLAAERKDIAGVILFASPALKGDTIIKYQITVAMKSEGKNEKEIDSVLVEQEKAYAMVRTGVGFESYEQTIRKESAKEFALMPVGRKKMFEDTAAAIESMVSAKLGQLKMPWFRFFIDYDPAADLRSIRVPVLALFGEKDMQVPAALNKPVLESLLETQTGGHDVRIKVIEGANHLFQEAKTGLSTEYGSLKKEYAPGVVDSITEWCVAKLQH